jgi:sugar (pentulose or hexulose) kinase
MDTKQRLYTIISPDGETNDCYGTVRSAGSTVEWAQETFGMCDETTMTSALRDIGPGADGLCVLPYLEREPMLDWSAKVRGVVFGITRSHTRDHLLRATAEGVCFSMRTSLDAIRDHVDVSRVRLITEPVAGEQWVQLLADVLDTTVEDVGLRPETAPLVGAARLADGSAGDAPEVRGPVSQRDITEVKPDPTVCRTYRPLYERFRGLYPSLEQYFADYAGGS